MRSSRPPIARLSPDLLLEIFDIVAQDHHASLTSAVRCCKAWQPIAQSAMYEDVILDEQRLAKFVKGCADVRIRSLTVLMNAVPVNPYDPSEAKEIAIARLASLAQLGGRVKQAEPATVSISVDLPFPCTASREVACIIESLAASYTSLEVKLSHGSCISPPLAALSRGAHLCDSIRGVLPQLRHLRLCLPVICPALLSTGSSNGQGQDQHCQDAVCAPLLKTCLVNLAQREPGPSTSGAWTTPCREDAGSDSLRRTAAAIAIGSTSDGRGSEGFCQSEFQQPRDAHHHGRATAQSGTDTLLRRLGTPRLHLQMQLSHSCMERRHLLELCTRCQDASSAEGTVGDIGLGFKFKKTPRDDRRGGKHMDTDQFWRALAGADDAQLAQARRCTLDSCAVSAEQQHDVHAMGRRRYDGAAFASRGTRRIVTDLGNARNHSTRLD